MKIYLSFFPRLVIDCFFDPEIKSISLKGNKDLYINFKKNVLNT